MTNLAQIVVLDLAKTALQASTARHVQVKPESVHPINKSLEASAVGRSLAAKEGFLGESANDLAGHVVVGFVAEFLHQLADRRGVEDVVLDRHILVIELVQETKRGHARSTVSESRLAEFGGNGLERVSGRLVCGGRRYLHKATG